MFMDRVRLDDRVVIVFGGAGGGMGTQTALAIAEAGAVLVTADMKQDRVDDTLERVADIGGTAHGVVADVRNREDIMKVFAKADELGGPDGLVNLVGSMRLATKDVADVPGTAWMPSQELPDDYYRDILDINMNYVFTSCQQFIRRLREQDRPGAIVNFASVSALAGAPYHSAYGMAKAAVMSLTRSLAVEHGDLNIRANCIVPGAVPAPSAQANTPEAFDNATQRASRIAPLGRRVAPEEIAGAVLFLLSDLSSGMTGQCLNVDAGVSANSPGGTGAEFWESTQLRRGL